MNHSTRSQYAIDNASILFLAQIRKDHTNTFRFTMTLTEDICPELLQRAVDRIYRRFPTVIAGFRCGLFRYFQIPSPLPPQVQPDPGCLITMSAEELRTCAFRVYYKEKTIAIEAFHALTDGYGAIACFTTMVAEYLHLKHGVQIPVSHTLLEPDETPMPHELEDSFLTYVQKESAQLPSRYAYQLPGGDLPRQQVWTSRSIIPAKKLLDAAHLYDVSVNTLLSTVMADSVMEVQQRRNSGKLLPVRIMVPVNLRRLFPSRTLRNFSYYALPTMEPQDAGAPLTALLHSFTQQIRAQIEKKQMGALISNNVKLQSAWFFRIIPMAVKRWLMRIICRFFGETNSSITVTNLGNVVMPPQMADFVQHMDVTLTPRMRSPYGCAILSYHGLLTITISRFPQETELEDIFFRKLENVLGGEAEA